MSFDITLTSILLLAGTGFLAGFINTIAGGGSMLTLPALMILGLPADIANGTNRIAVLFQGIAGTYGFHKKGKLSSQTLYHSLLPTLTGALVGALLASYLPVSILKPALLLTMLGLATLMLVKPSLLPTHSNEETHLPGKKPLAIAGLFLTGVYGGFVQAGIGFLLIAVYAGILGYDLVRANALKVSITAILTVIALIVFIARGQVLLVPGLLVAVGSVAGALLSVKFAINVPQVVLKWIMFAMILVVCLVAFFSQPAA